MPMSLAPCVLHSSPGTLRFPVLPVTLTRFPSNATMSVYCGCSVIVFPARIAIGLLDSRLAARPLIATQPMVQVIALEHLAEQLLEEIVVLVSAALAADAADVRTYFAQLIHKNIVGIVPLDSNPLVAPFEHRLYQPVLR